MGRKTKCTPEVVEKICESLRLGDFRVAAAESAGVSETTFVRWMAEGANPDGRQRYRAFRASVLEAEKASKSKALGVLDKSMESEDEGIRVKTATWVLERRHGFRREAHVKVDAKVNHTFNDDDLIDELQDLMPEDMSAGEE